MGYNLISGAAFCAGGGCIIGVVVLVIIAILFLTHGDVGLIDNNRETTSAFNSMPWQPPPGGDACDSCNDLLGNGEGACSAYKCQSLGQSCTFVNEGTDNEFCINENENGGANLSPPTISPNDAVGTQIRYGNVNENGFSIINENRGDGCLLEQSLVNFGITLSEKGQCKMGEIENEDYEDMMSFGGSNLYKTTHETIFATPIAISNGEEHDFYVKCRDSSGELVEEDFVVNFCIAKEDDTTAPNIIQFSIPSPQIVNSETSEKLVQFYTNEIALCKWSLDDKEFELMENAALCNGIINPAVGGWTCSALLPVSSSETNYYVRCKDQPWFAYDNDETNDQNRNANSESFAYTIQKVSEANTLKIVSVSPNGKIIKTSGVPLSSVGLEVETSGGSNDGKAQCQYSFNGEEGIFFGFASTGGARHEHSLATLFGGDHKVSIKCKDSGGNVALADALFSVEVDDRGPQLSRIYENPKGTLNIVTDEDATCAISYESCGFIFSDGEEMSGSGLVHASAFEQGRTHFVKCRDNFGNVGSCSKVAGGV